MVIIFLFITTSGTFVHFMWGKGGDMKVPHVRIILKARCSKWTSPQVVGGL